MTFINFRENIEMNHEIAGLPPEACAQELARCPSTRLEQSTASNGGKATQHALFGPLQLFWLRAAQASRPASPVIGRRPLHDDCE